MELVADVGGVRFVNDWCDQRRVGAPFHRELRPESGGDHGDGQWRRLAAAATAAGRKAVVVIGEARPRCAMPVDAEAGGGERQLAAAIDRG
jgi:hypothetical protein